MTEADEGVAVKMLTTGDVAERWQVTPGTVLGMAKAGVLPCVKVGRAYRYPIAGIEQWERDNRLVTA